MKKLLIALLLVFCLPTICNAGTYTHPEYGFSFEYPDKLMPMPKEINEIVFLRLMPSTPSPASIISFSILIEGFGEIKHPEAFSLFLRDFTMEMSPSSEIISYYFKPLNSTTCFIVESKDNAKNYKSAYIPFNGKLYVIDLAYDKKNKLVIAYWDEILENFTLGLSTTSSL